MKYQSHLLQLFAEETAASVEDTGVTPADAAQENPSDPGAEFRSCHIQSLSLTAAYVLTHSYKKVVKSLLLGV